MVVPHAGAAPRFDPQSVCFGLLSNDSPPILIANRYLLNPPLKERGGAKSAQCLWRTGFLRLTCTPLSRRIGAWNNIYIKGAREINTIHFRTKSCDATSAKSNNHPVSSDDIASNGFPATRPKGQANGRCVGLLIRSRWRNGRRPVGAVLQMIGFKLCSTIEVDTDL